MNIGSTMNHDCIIGDKCWIGICAKIINNISIGKGSFIVAGAVVVKDIPEDVLAIGVPAKPVRNLKEYDWEELI